MEARLRMRIEYQEPHSQRIQVPFINVLPSQPYAAYQKFEGKELDTIKKTQKIPFTTIRELILMYSLENENVIDLAHSDLFVEKLSNSKINKQHNESNHILDNLLKQQKKLQKLREVTKKYIDGRSKVVSSDLVRNIKSKYNSSRLKDQLTALQRKKENQFKNLAKKVLQSKGFLKEDPQQKGKIQQNYNKELLTILNNTLPQLKTKSQQFCTFFQQLIFFRSYNQQFQKALVYIMSNQKINNRKIMKSQEGLLKQFLQKSLKIQTEQLNKRIDKEMSAVFTWRMKVKYGESIDMKKIQDPMGKNNLQDIRKNIYESIPDIIAILKTDREQANTVERQIRNLYTQFLPNYLKALQVDLFYKKQSKIEEILKKQEQRLIIHLKQNYSMMVFYSKSQEYTTCIEEYRTKSKGYLYDILKKKIGFLDIAINFINKDYGQLYKEACDGKNGIKEKIKAKCKYLQDNLHENTTILDLLRESCRRLFNIVQN